MDGSQEVFVGIAWFRPEQWELLREVAADPDILEATHGEWEKLARQAINDFAKLGILARRVDVDVQRLQAWCADHQRPLDASARAAYATERLRYGSEFA